MFPGTCLDDEQLAAYIDGRVDKATRDVIEAHLAACTRCRTILTETSAFIKANDSQRARAIWERKWPKAMIAAALAAGVILAIGLAFVRSRRAGPTARPELAELVAAATSEPTRLAEGRLTGGFPYKPAPVATRGATGRRISPEVKIAAAKIEQASRGKDSAAADAALGASYLAVGELDQAIERLEDAVQQRPDEARYQNDLAVAYIARASTADRVDDWPKALAAAERATKRDPSLVEPCFNRALALEGLTLAREAAEAWSTCAQREAGSPWANEARARAEAIRDRLNSAKPKQSNQQRREEIEDRVFVRWAEAEGAGDEIKSAALLDEADRLSRALAENGGDTMARDEVALIRRTRRGSRERMALAKGHLAYGRAREAFIAERLTDASRDMSIASESFAIAGSSYAHWSPVYRAISLWMARSIPAALQELSSIPLDGIPASYCHLRGRIAWTKGVALEIVGHLDDAGAAFEQARDLFRHGGEREYESVNASYLAYIDWFLGRPQQMWRDEVDALEQVDSLPSGARRSAVLWGAGIVALGEGLPETALAFQQHLFRLSEAEHREANFLGDPNAFLRRAQMLGRLGDTNAAIRDLALADASAAKMPDSRYRKWMAAEVSSARAELLALTDPAAAIAAASSALALYEPANSPVRTSELLLARARAHEAWGELVAAEDDYAGAVSALEHNLDSITALQERKAAFDQQRAAVSEAVRFAAVVRRNPSAALRIAERSRGRTLRQALGGSSSQILDPTTIHKSLPRDVAVLYYATLPDRVLGWLITTDRVMNFSVPVDSSRLDLVARRLHFRITNDAAVDEVNADFEYLKRFTAPALNALAPGTTVVVVPDEGFATIPFAAMPDANGAPLVVSHPILFAPSFTTFMLASWRLSGFTPNGVVAIGDGHDPAATGLPRLPLADSEASEVARLYPNARLLTGPNATTRNFLSARQSVIHFAGHTIGNAKFPFLSRLLFAPDAGGSDQSGVLLASDVATHRFATTKVAVLASCESAEGKVIRGEGFDSVARIFMDAGVPSVVASLWSVDDDQTKLLTEFHRQLRARHDVAQALRAAQLKIIFEQPDRASIRRWAGFVAIGGMYGLQLFGDGLYE
jgi:CHAT domain-containing protein